VPTCFIAIPISTSSEQAQVYNDATHFSHVLMHLMVPAVERAGYEAIRPIAAGADLIHAEIIRQLETADLVLCDISTLNPNVFFELGIRTAVDKPVCIVKDKLTERIPFDTSIINVHTYEPSLSPWLLEREIDTLAEHLRTSAKRSGDRNTLWRYFGLTTRAAFKEGESSLDEKVDLLLLQLQGIQSQARSSAATVDLDRGLGHREQSLLGEQVDAIFEGEAAIPLRYSATRDAITIGYAGALSQTAKDKLEELGKRWRIPMDLHKVD
jgi:hypothetical protein